MKNVPCIPCEARIGAAGHLVGSAIVERQRDDHRRRGRMRGRRVPEEGRRNGAGQDQHPLHQELSFVIVCLPPAGDRRANRPVHRADQIARRHPVEDLDARERAPHAPDDPGGRRRVVEPHQESRHQDLVEEPGHRRVVRRDPVRREWICECVAAAAARGPRCRPSTRPGRRRPARGTRRSSRAGPRPAATRRSVRNGPSRAVAVAGSGRGRRGVVAEAPTARSAASPRPRPSRGSTAGGGRRRP